MGATAFDTNSAFVSRSGVRLLDNEQISKSL